MEQHPKTAETILVKHSRADILAKTVKTGIIKSNLIPMWAGLSLGMYKNQLNLMEQIPEILFATVGSALVIGAAGAFNNVYDRDIDAIMQRTKSRPTVTGEMSVKTTLTLAIVLLVIGVVVLALASPLSALFGFLGVFLYVVPYTMWTKRRTIYNTEVGSFSGAVTPLVGWAAVASDITHPALIGLFCVM
ncbi:MAG: UbiA family prenyltransferase, partial [Lysinibacillus sp.]